MDLEPIEMAPLGSASIDVNAVVRALGYVEPAFGGAVFSYEAEHGGRLSVETAVSMPANQLLYSVESFTGFEKKSNVQHSAFWLPTSGTEVFYAVFNESDEAVTLKPKLQIRDQAFALESVRIPAKGFAKRRLGAAELADYARRAGRESGDLVGGITLEHDGPPEALYAAGWVDDGPNGYSNMMSFADPAAASGQELHGVQLLVGKQPALLGPGRPLDLRTRVVLRNITVGSLTAGAVAYYQRGGSVLEASLPPLKLGPGAAAEYDLNALRKEGVLPADVSEILLKVDYFAAPGSLMGRAYSISSDLSYGLYSVLESDGTGLWSGVYWSLKDDDNTVLTVANIGREETTAVLELAYPGGTAKLKPAKLRPRETVTWNLRRDLPRLLADRAGRLPAGAASGGYQVRALDDPLRADLVVKQHVLSPSRKTAAPFYGSCAYVTAISLGGATWPTINLLVGGTHNVQPRCSMSTGGWVVDYGAVLQPDGGNQISITPTFGETRTITGLATGQRAMVLSDFVPTISNPCGAEIMQGTTPPALVVNAANLVGAVTDWQQVGADQYHVTLTGPGIGVGLEYGFMSMGQMVQTLPCPIPGFPCAVVNGVNVLVKLSVTAYAVWELWQVWQQRVDSPYGWPGWDGTVAPGPEWTWQGTGPVGSAQGNWHNPSTGESLHPDLNHGEPYGPHWDLKDAQGKWWRIWPDGKMTPKPE